MLWSFVAVSQLSDRLATFPTSLAGVIGRGTEAGQFPGPTSAASPRGTPAFIEYGAWSATVAIKFEERLVIEALIARCFVHHSCSICVRDADATGVRAV